MAKASNYIGGEHCTEKMYNGRGDNWDEETTYKGGGHCTDFIDGGTIRVGTLHNIERKFSWQVCGVDTF